MIEGMGDTMLAGRLDLDKREFGVEEVPIPVPGPGEVRIAVAAAGVCLSDLHLIDGTLPGTGRVTLGHEVSGTIEALGPDVPEHLTTGLRVTLQAGQSCDVCDRCLRRLPCRRSRVRGVHYDGGWAEYALARADTVVPIPDDLPFDQAAIIPDAVSTPYAAVVATAQVRPASSAGVWGAGGLGVHGLQVLRLAGAAPIVAIDPLPAARERALTFGADFALDPAAADFAERIGAWTEGRGLDYAFDFAAVREQAAGVLGAQGAMVLTGLTDAPLHLPDSTGLSVRGQRILGHFGSSGEHVLELVTLARYGRLDLSRSISAHIPLAEADRAVKQLAEKSGDPIRLILVP
ncbi:zinc-binding dehydrogenase [Amycolatopsis sp. NPDC049252]|uniref:zinc-binding dehydrogenase n=1 Tax=Amycolatopsis sp. NPDC049252 TaxID=3363933 RepID=UPI00371D0811